jgi:hypothetical protein
MYMCNCGACLSCSQASFGNLFRRDGKVRCHAGQRLIASYSARDDDFIARILHKNAPMLGDQFNHCLYREENRFAIRLRANVVAMDQPCRFRARESELR